MGCAELQEALGLPSCIVAVTAENVMPRKRSIGTDLAERANDRCSWTSMSSALHDPPRSA
jgi:hypothetical protein